jgi:hypothetical protein
VLAERGAAPAGAAADSDIMTKPAVTAATADAMLDPFIIHAPFCLANLPGIYDIIN